MKIEQNHSLQPYNSFGIEISSRYFSSFSSIESLEEIIAHQQKSSDPLLVLGGGSNILFTKNFDGWVIKNDLKGIEVINRDNNFIYVKAMAGENWHQLVLHCVENGYAGMENLSLIPGNVGASPMQNIGAYGVELKDVFYELEAYHIADKKIVRFNNKDCAFGYRESVFKRALKNQYIILSVTYQLRKEPVYNTSYGAIEQELAAMKISTLSIKAISDAVINIRSSKLPDPKKIGNAGSFFKNPVIPTKQFDLLKKSFPELPGYTNNEDVKLPAGWLIERAGWKGFRNGDAGCYDKQALVLVNYGKASGAEIYELSSKIIHSVQEKFGINLEREVNII
jgi:UDP-N-acetylmuramate dehydrogenase